MNADKWIIITTINRPTAALRRFAGMAAQGWGTVVVGDTKTPSDWALDGAVFLSVERQAELYGDLARLIPTRHYSRKNLGYLYAIEHGAKLILDTDDDNIPDVTFGEGLAEQVTGRTVRGPGWVNVYRHFTHHPRIWPRGLPLNAIGCSGTIATPTVTARCPVQQFLADGDPDVDAIYRLLYTDPVNFDRTAKPVILAPDTWVPFNSQNTVFYPEAFPLLYLPCHVSFRMTDIWRSFVAQATLSSRKWSLSFHGPTVVQERNAHDLMRDFADEVPGYLNNDAIIKLLAERAPALTTLPVGLAVIAMWEALVEREFVPYHELDIARAWQARVTA